MPGEGDQWGGAAGGTIGSGDPYGNFNASLRWGFDGLTDEPGRFEVTVWLDTNARGETCTVDITPRRCQKFKAKAGDVFKWNSTPTDGGGETESGQATADKWGCVTLRNVRVAKGRNRITITAGK